jgi:iron complex outermembrane receptor protein
MRSNTGAWPMYAALFSTTSFLVFAAFPAAAQVVSEVVVTAEKREGDIQEIPVAITAFGAEKREVMGINSIQDMTNFTPGLQYNTSTDRISLRGVGRQTNVLSGDASVANYNDGIYETFAVSAGRSTLYIDRVEVLRGPQGTLYGRNAIGGAINQISKQPSKTFEGEARLLYGNYNRYVAEGMISGPIMGDRVRGRLGVSFEKQTEGWIDNVIPGMPDEGNVLDTFYYDAQLAVDITDKLEFWGKIAGGHWDNGAGGPGAQSGGWYPSAWTTYETGVDNTQVSAGYGCNVGGFATNVVNRNPGGCVNPAIKTPWKIARVVPYKVQLPVFYQTALHLTYHADKFDIRLISGGTYYHYILTGPTGTEPNTLIAPIESFTVPGSTTVINNVESFNYRERNSFWSNEINFLSTTDGPVQWVAGLYQFKQEYTQPVYTTNPNQPQWKGPFVAVCGTSPCVTSPEPRRFDNRPAIDAFSYAAFGQIDWTVNDQWKLTGGLRYSHDRKAGTESVRLICLSGAFCNNRPEGGLIPLDLTGIASVVDNNIPAKRGTVGPTVYDANGFATRRYDASWQAISGTLGVEYKPDDLTLVYGRYSRGYKSGGLNIGIFTVLSTGPFTDKELVDSYEVGLKRDFTPTLQGNIAVYSYDYKNLQIPVRTAGAGGLAPAAINFYNVPEAKSQGIEIESNWRPVERAQITLSYSYNKTEITRGEAVDDADPAALSSEAKPLVTPAQCAIALCRVDPFTTGLPNGGYYRAQNLSGNSLPNAPENKFAINGLYRWDLFGGELIGSASYVWRSEQYGTLFTRKHYEAPAWDQIDLRATWDNADKTVRIIAYVKNLKDELGYDAGGTAYRKAGRINGNVGDTQILVNEGIAQGFSVTPPRTFGVEFQYKF